MKHFKKQTSQATNISYNEHLIHKQIFLITRTILFSENTLPNSNISKLRNIVQMTLQLMMKWFAKSGLSGIITDRTRQHKGGRDNSLFCRPPPQAPAQKLPLHILVHGAAQTRFLYVEWRILCVYISSHTQTCHSKRTSQ
jgi:hypothetical protein